MLQPGALDQRVSVSRLTVTSDGVGGSVETWATIGTYWAKVKAVSGTENNQGDNISAVAEYQFTFSNRLDIKESDKLIYNGVEYNIKAKLPNSRMDLYMDIRAERGVAQ